MVQINFEVAESNSRTVAPTDIAIVMMRDNSYIFNGNKIKKTEVEARVRKALTKLEPEEKKVATLTIIAEKGVPYKQIYEMIKIANKNKMRAIIGTQPKKS